MEGDKDVWVSWDQEARLFRARLLLRDDGRPTTWNGWLVPLFSREAADQILQVNAEIVARHGPDSVSAFRWYGDVLVERDPQMLDLGAALPDWPQTLEEVRSERATNVDSPFEVLDPTPTGRYAVGGFAWTWMEWDECPLSEDGTCLHGLSRDEAFPHNAEADQADHGVFPEIGPGGVDRHVAEEIEAARRS